MLPNPFQQTAPSKQDSNFLARESRLARKSRVLQTHCRLCAPTERTGTTVMYMVLYCTTYGSNTQGKTAVKLLLYTTGFLTLNLTEFVLVGFH